MIEDKDLVREAPETWCAGGGKVCGYFNFRKQFLSALSEYMNKYDLSKDDVIGISGIGCSGRFTVWQDLVTVHTTHGNAPNLAQGVALMREINKKKGLVYVVSGDGDAIAIGRSNFENLCHSNADVTYLILNNGIYAMTSGQTAPTTGQGLKTVSAPYGNLEEPWDVVSLAIGSGATFVARVSSYPKESKLLRGILYEAFEHKGTSVVEIVSACPTQNPLNKGKNLLQLEKEYMGGSLDIKFFDEYLFSGISSNLRYAIAKDYAKSKLGKDVLLKGRMHKVEKKSYSQLLCEQKKKVKESYGEEKLSDRIKKLLNGKKVELLQ